MKQVQQNLSTGETELVEAPVPIVRRGGVLIDTTVSLISAGTERMLVDFGRASLLAKARSQPERVKQVLDKIRTDGLATTVDAVRTKLAQPLPLGYCNVGTISDSRSDQFARGDRVVSNGLHADVVSVPQNLCARIPDGVDDESAVFTVLASIGLQGIRLASPTLGESFVVTGVGLIGLLALQMLRANGCRVLAIDLDERKLELARSYGAETCNPHAGEDPIAAGLAFSRGRGVDGVLITASTKSSAPVSQAAKMSRKRGRIVLVGVAGLELDRTDFYEKELSFQVSCSYGPGRYDSEYEENGHDYPLGHVRWTEQRNFEAVLDMMASGSLDVSRLITHRIPFDQAPRAYDVLSDDPNALGILLEYEHDKAARHNSEVLFRAQSDLLGKQGQVTLSVIGAGNYASRILVPAFKDAGANLATIASAGGANAVIHGERSGFASATSDTEALLADAAVDAVAIATRHDTHAVFTIKALEAGKHVWVEKPLALTQLELAKLEQVHSNTDRCLMVGFNRRFAPQIITMQALISQVQTPKAFVMIMNAGATPAGHWTQDPEIGGGRIIGEACHHIDLMRYLAGAPIVSVQARALGKSPEGPAMSDCAVISLGFSDGSVGTVHYLSNGGSAFPKERVEVFAGGRSLQLDNFIRLRGFNWPGFKKQYLWRQDKGHTHCARAFVRALETGGAAPIPAEQLFEVAKVTIDVAEILRAQT